MRDAVHGSAQKAIKAFDSMTAATDWTSRLTAPHAVRRLSRVVGGRSSAPGPVLVEMWRTPVPADASPVLETVHRHPEPRAGGVVRAIFVRRAPHLSRSEFAHHWNSVHAPLVLECAPRFTGYVTNVFFDDIGVWDGLMEQWFDDATAAERQVREALHDKRAVADDIQRFIAASEIYETHDSAWPRSFDRSNAE